MPHDTTVVSDAATPRSEDLRSLEAGLDRLQTSADRPTSRWRRITASVLPPVIFVAVLIVIWQLVRRRSPSPGPTSSPDRSMCSAHSAPRGRAGRLQEAVLTSLDRGIVGFLIAIVVGTPIGCLLAEVRPIRRAIGPIISGLQVLPSVAWVPAAIIWFGLSDATVYFVILMGAIPSIVNGLIAGVDQVPPQLRRVGTVLGATKLQLATAVILPAALPGYLAGLKQGWAFSWRSLMAAEIIAVGGTIGFGLGSMLQQVARTRRPRGRARHDPRDPVHRHPDRTALLRTPRAADAAAPGPPAVGRCPMTGVDDAMARQ